MLWVHFDGNFEVYSVYAKRYEGHIGLDENTIYSLSWALNTTTHKMKYGVPDMFINDSLFLESFP
jgi:hypothetical protein